MRFFTVFSCLLFLLALISCSKTTEDYEAENVSMTFRVSNYMQYSLDEITRSTSKADTLAHLAFAIYDAATDAPVGRVVMQNRGDSGYGTFNVTLPKGKYRFLFLGYDGNKACHIDSQERIYFDDSYVPLTFICNKELTLDGTQSALQIVLQRVVAAFRVDIVDALPSNLVSFRLTCQNGGVVLNGKTGYVDAKNSTGRSSVINIPSSYLNIKDAVYLTSYLYLPSDELSVDYVVEALDAKGNVIKSRTFSSVPMRLNVLTNYKGNFFEEDTPSSEASSTFNIGVDTEWKKIENYTF